MFDILSAGADQRNRVGYILSRSKKN